MFVSLIVVGIIDHHCLSFVIIISVDTISDTVFISEYYCRVGQQFIHYKQIEQTVLT